MRAVVNKLRKIRTATVIMALLSVFFFLRSEAKGETIVYPGATLADPSVIFNTNAPVVPNSLFPHTSSGSNTVTIKSGTISGHVFGGIAADNIVDANGNSVIIDGGTAGVTIGNTGTTPGGNVTGGWSYNGNSKNNEVEISNATIRGIVFGGWVNGGSNNNTQSNVVTIGSNATVRDNIYGGYSQGQNGTISLNEVVINGGSVTKNGGIIAGGYSAILINTVSGNSVTINNGSITNSSIYGGRGQSTSQITANAVVINGGAINVGANSPGAIYGGQSINGTATIDLNTIEITGGTINATIYGGYSGGKGTVQGNEITMTGGAITGDMYGGYSSSGSATNNTVTIGGTVILGAGTNLYGGYVASGGGDAFTGNTLNKNDNATVSTARNFEFVNFGYSGNANIGTLDITATGSGQSGVTLNTDTFNVNFDGTITGTGNLTKMGTGTLILTGNNSNIQNGIIQIQEGTLQLGNGGTTGSVVTQNGFVVSSGAALAYNHSNNVTETQKITGAGTVIQRGTGTLTVSNTSNSFTGGTEIESGTLNIANVLSLNKADGKYLGTKAGYITFTGTTGTKNINLLAPNTASDEVWLINSFRTQIGAGNNNYVNLIPPKGPLTFIYGVDIADKGGAFYVAGGTTMNVTASSLILSNNKTNGVLNDLYVDTGGIFNLNASGFINFYSGIDGDGTLNITTSATTPAGLVQLFSSSNWPNEQTFRMGTTNIIGTSDHIMFFNLTRENLLPVFLGGNTRVVFENADSFSISGDGSFPSAVLNGSGTIKAGDTINATNGAVLAPFIAETVGTPSAFPGTLTLEAPEINLTDFGLAIQVNYPPYTTQAPLVTDTDGTLISSNDLLNLVSTDVTMTNGKVFFQTANGTPFTPGDYLVIRSSNGFNGITSNAQLNAALTANVDGFDLPLSTDGPRGTYSFQLGGDPNASGAMTTGTTDVWFTHGFNSLSMAWTGLGKTEAAPTSGNWSNGALFYSLQANGTNHESQFLTGDKVYLSGTNTFGVELPASSFLSKITVSGFVVGQDMFGTNTDGGSYTISGEGGITADANSAFGTYINSSLVPTGKLEKFGSSTLTFTNTGGNLFKEGIDLYGGTIGFTQADQLGDDGQGIHFLGNATLRALNNVALENNLSIADGITANLDTAGNATLTYIGTGMISGSALTTLQKSGTGTLQLVNSGTAFFGNMTVSGGTLDVIGDYRNTTQFQVKSGATLSGTGILGGLSGGGTIESGGTLKPGNLGTPLTINGDLTFAAGGNFDVYTQYDNGILLSNQVKVDGLVSIDPEAKLNVAVDYWANSQSILSDRFTIIDASAGTVEDASAQFILYSFGLPRGMAMLQGWNGNSFDLWFDIDPNNGFSNLCTKHNRSEIGRTLDWFIANHDPGLTSLITRLSDPSWTDAEVCKQLDQIHGDLAPNALFMALKEPWRHPFNRLVPDANDSSPNDQRYNVNRFRRQLWGEFTARHENVGYDDNAHGFTVNRYGIAVGMDQRLSRHSVIGVTFQYAEPQLRQENGHVKMDDYEIGLYNMTRLTDKVDMKAYLGYSRQRYNFDRYVTLPASSSGHYEALNEQLSGTTNGDALAASLELIRPIPWRNDIRFLPVAAFDFEQAWMRGYQESSGETSLIYDSATLERMMLRFGVSSEYHLRNRLAMNLRLQYATQVNGREYPSLGVRFANGVQTNQRTADIWGSRIGRDRLNLGVGANWKLNDRGDTLLTINYDADFYHLATFHTGEVGFLKKW